MSRIGRTLYIAGTDQADTIRIDVVPKGTSDKVAPKKVQVVFNDLKVNGAVPQLDAAPIKKVLINGAGGDDNIIIAPGLTPAFKPRTVIIRGGAGNDTIFGGDLYERIYGEAGDDVLNGGSGKDRIDGGEGNDTITGGPAMDVLIGGPGDDTFKNLEPGNIRPPTGPGKPRDIVIGGPGNDNAQADPADIIHDDVENKNAV